MIPSPWVGLVLALAVFRLTRLVGWDEFPPVLRARNWITGMYATTRGSTNARLGTTSEKVEPSFDHRRPVLAHFLGCAYCVGFWIGLAIYLLWVWFPTETLYATAPFALSGAVGIIARQLDP